MKGWSRGPDESVERVWEIKDTWNGEVSYFDKHLYSPAYFNEKNFFSENKIWKGM